MTRLVASLCGTALLAFVMSANATTPPVPVLNWNPCSPDGAICAAAQVPLDYDDPAGAKTFIVLARYPVNPATKIGTVFVNFGGPGVSGVTRLIQSGFGLNLADPAAGSIRRRSLRSAWSGLLRSAAVFRHGW